jgi:alpha-L-rhamnosidase
VTSTWTRRDGLFTLSVSVPVGATSTVFVPAERRRTVTEPVGATFVGVARGYAEFTVGSGEYLFRSADS